MRNVIPTRIYEFLEDIPPFTLLSKKDLMDLCENVVIRYIQPVEIVFGEGDLPKPFIYVVHDGAIHLKRKKGSHDILVDQCGEGDLFGLRPVVAKDNYKLTAVAEEETLLYGIKVESLQIIIQKQPSIAWYLAQHFAAGGTSRLRKSDQTHMLKKPLMFSRDQRMMVELQAIEHSRNPVVCGPDKKIQDVAQQMRYQKVGSMIVVNDEQHPIGILTNRDLRNKVVTGEFPIDAKISDVMSSPVITIPTDFTVADVQIEMMRHHIHHLCITENGRSDSKVVGVISEHDLLVIQGQNPAIFVREMRRTQKLEDLKRIREETEKLLFHYLKQEVSIRFISRVITEVNTAMVIKAIEMSHSMLKLKGLSKPEVDWCWLSLGSGGRAEQLLRTDQDHALVFADVPADQIAEVEHYFLSLAQRVSAILLRCGFEFCPAEMMASNPKWCMSLHQWKEQFSSWVKQPSEENIMFCTIFFDFRPIYGDNRLAEKLSEHILQSINRKSIFLNFLARNAIQKPPPLTFFRNFMVEKGGTHKDTFDLKTRAMMPLVDAARVLILNAGKPLIKNTLKRFEALAALEPQNKDLYEQAARAYEILMRYRAIQGLKNDDNGRYFVPSQLTKMERVNLRNSFRPINDLQELLQVRFQLSIIM